MTADHLLDALVPLLVDEVLSLLADQKSDTPLCRLKLWYYDTSAPCCYFLGDAMTQSQRTQILATDGRNALCDIWDETGTIEFTVGLDEARPTYALLAQIYDLMSSDDPEEFEQGHELRRTLVHNVAMRLNETDVSAACPVTDDFVVYAQNGTDYGCDTYEDICASVPASKLELLRSRELMGPGEDYDSRPGYDYDGDPDMAAMVRSVIERAEALSPPERIAYWIDQLDQMAAGQDGDMKRIEVNAHFPLDHVGELGHQAVVPLLRLACKWADKPQWDRDPEGDERAEKTPMSNVILLLLWKIQELRYGDREVELLLREFFDKSCRANAGRTLWGTLPFHCADTLHKLFDRYPKPEMAGHNTLADPEQFLAVPPP